MYQTVEMVYRDDTVGYEMTCWPKAATQMTPIFMESGKMMMQEAYREAKKMSMIEDVHDVTLVDYSIFNEEDLSHERSVVKDILNRLEDPCKKLLTLYYFKSYSLESIAESMGYKNQGVVKKKKCLCLKSIRTKLTELKWRG